MLAFTKANLKHWGKVTLRVLGVLLILIVVMLPVIRGIVGAGIKKASGGISDTTILDYEAYSAGLTNLLLIYGVHDEASYREAMTKCDISDTLRSEFFGAGRYTGEVTSKPAVNIITTEYEISENTGTRLYYVVLELQRSDTIKYYRILAEIAESTLVDYRVLGVS